MDEMSFCSFSGGEEFKNHFQPGIYACSECGHELFSSKSKFEHSSPWPAFSETIHEDSVSKHPEAWGPLKHYMMSKGDDHQQLFDLIGRMMEYDPAKRLSLEQALRHPFFSCYYKRSSSKSSSSSSKKD